VPTVVIDDQCVLENNRCFTEGEYRTRFKRDPPVRTRVHVSITTSEQLARTADGRGGRPADGRGGRPADGRGGRPSREQDQLTENIFQV
jgi:hypothetical protein